MKTISVLLLALLFSFSINACNNDDNVTPDTLDPIGGQAIIGVWHIHHVLHGIQGGNSLYDRNEVIYDFDLNSLKVNLENNISGIRAGYAGPISGQYDFSIEQRLDAHYLSIDGIQMGALFKNQEGELVLNDSYRDGPIRTLQR